MKHLFLMYRIVLLLVAALPTPLVLAAQSPATGSPGGPANLRTQASIDEQGKTLLADAAKAPSGLATLTLEKYPGHLTMLTARVRDSGAELHKASNDIFIAEQGEAIVITGGTIPSPKEASPGEIRGIRVDGGTRHVMHKGDILHISAGVPHQTLIPGGKTFLYYVVKVDAPTPLVAP